MMPDEIKQRMQAIIEQHGEWIAHTIDLGHGVRTHQSPNDRYGDQVTTSAHRVKRLLQAVADLVNKPLSQCRILDLAFLEGQFAIEFALQGAEVVGIEGRESNLAKAQFAKEVLELDNVSFVLDDVRNLSADRYGYFDVVLCMGIFYHLDAPDVFDFAQRLYEVCNRVCIIDTHTATEAEIIEHYDGRSYRGIKFDERNDSALSSLGNDDSFWLTRASLLNLFSDVGFSSIHAIEMPLFVPISSDRVWIAAIKGKNREVKTIPGIKTDSRYIEQ